MKKIFLLLAIIFLFQTSKGQYVTIPDTFFVSYLQTNFPSAMNGNLMDTTDANIVGATGVNCGYSYISDLTGIQYFDNLIYLNCEDNNLTNLPNLPNTLINLNCYENHITSLPNLPSTLKNLNAWNNNLTFLPTLPNGLILLSCSGNNIITLPSTLPITLNSLYCNNNQITSLPVLPPTLSILVCGYNQISTLPMLPNTLSQLDCSYNQLTSIPNLPNVLNDLNCSSNQVSTLPALPNKLKYLNCQLNLNLNCLPYIYNDSLYSFNVRYGTNISCIPKIFSYLNSYDSSDYLPICTLTSGCPIAYNIIGNIHQDTSSTCLNDSLNNGLKNINVKVMKYKNNILDHQFYTNYFGQYSFAASIGDSINIKVDTTAMPFKVACPTNGMRIANITLTDSIFLNQDFGIQCKGVDIGVEAIFGSFRPNKIRPIYIKAGDISHDYNLNCGNGVSGTVTTLLNGYVSYVSPWAGALTPTSIVGNTITYNIPDFGLIDINNAFNILVHTDTNAILGSNICVQTIVSTTANDINHSNDTLQYCGVVVNSFDPNEKIAYPTNTATPNSWITYTINFQNTGTDTAYHIFVRDTLSNYLDESTFTYLGASVEPQIDIAGKSVLFNFPNINLVDSFHNEPQSYGWVQYKIKTKTNLPLNATIKNTGYIYFDGNAPVVTNTTHNSYYPLSINNVNKNIEFSLFPNPTEGILQANYTTEGILKISNIYGAEIFNIKLNKLNTTQKIQLPNVASGLYLYEFKANDGGVANGRLMVK